MIAHKNGNSGYGAKANGGDSGRLQQGAAEAAELPSVLDLELQVQDPEVIRVLLGKPAGLERNRYAQTALRLGVQALRLASGQVDSRAIAEAGQKLIVDLREQLTSHSNVLTTTVNNTLEHYFKPGDGLLEQRIEGFLKQDGELERLLRQHVDGDKSVLAQTIASYLGESSPIFRLLSPNESEGLRSQVQQVLEAALKQQSHAVLSEFSLDNEDSALKRLVREIGTQQGAYQADLEKTISGLTKQLSFDSEDSALSRLVGRVDKVQRGIAALFSADNEESALNKISKMLEVTNGQIQSNLTLDSETSALSLLRRELSDHLGAMKDRNASFHAEVKATLARLEGKAEEAEKSTRHGFTFEDCLGTLLMSQSQAAGDVHASVGSSTGKIKHCKVGDHVIELGPESLAPGVNVVWEAKDDKSYDLRKARTDIEQARKNRDAQLGVFVFSKKRAPEGMAPFTRLGNDLFVVWDHDDAHTDVYVQVAYSVTRALAIRANAEKAECMEALVQIEAACRVIEKQASHMDEVRKWAQTIQNNSGKIIKRVELAKKDLTQEVEHLEAALNALHSSDS